MNMRKRKQVVSNISNECIYGFYPSAYPQFSRPPYKKYATLDDLKTFIACVANNSMPEVQLKASDKVNNEDDEHTPVGLPDKESFSEDNEGNHTKVSSSDNPCLLIKEFFNEKCPSDCVTESLNDASLAGNASKSCANSPSVRSSFGRRESRASEPQCRQNEHIAFVINHSGSKPMHKSAVKALPTKNVSCCVMEIQNLSFQTKGSLAPADGESNSHIYHRATLPKRPSYTFECKLSPGRPKPPEIHHKNSSVFFHPTVVIKPSTFDINPCFRSERITKSGFFVQGVKSKLYNFQNYAFCY